MSGGPDGARCVYLAATYSDHPLMREWRAALLDAGYTVSSRWIDRAHSIADSADDRECQRFAEEDLEDLQRAAITILHSDAGQGERGRGGRHTEFGASLAWGKRIIIVGKRENVFHWLESVEVVADFDAALRLLATD